MPHIIVLHGCPRVMPAKLASEAITPGHLVEIVPSGGSAGQLRKHATAGGNAQGAWAVQRATPDRHVATEAVETPYAIGESVNWVIADSDDGIYALVAAAAAAIIEGDALESAGNGTVRKHTPQSVAESGSATYTIKVNAIVGYAGESLDNSGGATAGRLRVYAR